MGHEVTWFCRSFKYGKNEETVDGIKVIRRGNLITMYLFAPIYYWGLQKKPDVVIDISNTIYWQTPLWAWRSRKIAYLNQLAQDVFYYEYPVLISRFGRFIEKLQYLIYLNTNFACYAQSTKSDLITMGIDPEKVNVFSLGIDHKRYIPGIKSKTPLFICVNRLVRMKRTDLAIKAMSLLNKTHPEAKLVIVGTGYDRPRLEKLRDDLNLQITVTFSDENVWFFNKNQKDKKIQLMQRAWALVFPSVKEGWGMTVTESAACGTPSIVTDVTGLRNSVVKDKTGLIVSSNPTLDELSKSMERIIVDSELRNRLSKNALQFSKNFNWDNSCQQFERIITEIR
jgi:glycosyltransferase involved in cell wall biosynthesis